MADNNQQQVIPANYTIPTKQKVVFLGDQAVGKTSILNRFIQGTFYEADRPTIGIDFITKSVSIDNKIVKLQLWDTAGQERFKSLIPSYIRDCNIETNTFANVKSWFDLVKEQKGSNVIIFLCGNKLDLDQKRQVSQNEALKMAEQIDGQYLEVSAKSGDNIEELFRQIALQTSNNLLMSYSSQVSVSQSFDHRNVLFIGNKAGQTNQQQQNPTGNQKQLQNNIINSNLAAESQQKQYQQEEGGGGSNNGQNKQQQQMQYKYENSAQKKSNIQNFQSEGQQQQQQQIFQKSTAQKLDVNKHQNINQKSGGGCC